MTYDVVLVVHEVKLLIFRRASCCPSWLWLENVVVFIPPS